MAGKMQMHQKAGNYFGTLNPLAEKINADIVDISSAYANLWSTFSKDEQNELIDVTLIKPNLILKYVDELKMERNLKKRRSSAMLSKDDATIITDTDSNNDRLSISSSSNSNSYRSNDFSHIYLYNGKDLCTYGQIITALRYNQDDLCGVYRDEHSEPFNSKTKSQMNLNFSNTADVNAKFERAQKKFPEIKPAIAGLDAVDGVVKKGVVDHVMPELRAKLASLNNGNGGSGVAIEHAQDGGSSVVRKSFMTRLFSGKNNAIPMNVPSPRVAPPPPPPKPTTITKTTAPIDLSGIDLGIQLKSALSSKPNQTINDTSRLIDVNDNNDDNAVDDDDNDDIVNGNNTTTHCINNILNESADYDFLNNW